MAAPSLALTTGMTLEAWVMPAATRAVAGPIETSALPLRFGGNASWGEFFSGRIDDLRIYNRALSQGEVQINMGTPVQ